MVNPPELDLSEPLTKANYLQAVGSTTLQKFSQYFGDSNIGEAFCYVAVQDFTSRAGKEQSPLRWQINSWEGKVIKEVLTALSIMLPSLSINPLDDISIIKAPDQFKHNPKFFAYFLFYYLTVRRIHSQFPLLDNDTALKTYLDQGKIDKGKFSITDLQTTRDTINQRVETIQRVTRLIEASVL